MISLPKPKKHKKAKRHRERVVKPSLKSCASLWSQFIRRRDGVCQAQGQTTGRHLHVCLGDLHLQAAHGFGKKVYPATRFEPWNGFALCASAHTYYTWREPEWQNYLRSRWGNELYEMRLREACKATKHDFAAIEAELIRLISLLPIDTRTYMA